MTTLLNRSAIPYSSLFSIPNLAQQSKLATFLHLNPNMTNQLHNAGEEDIMDAFFGQTLTLYVGLYNDSSDNLSDAATLPLASEPSDGNYARETLSLPGDMTKSIASGDAVYESGQVSFDVTDTTGTVDSYFIATSADNTGDVLWTGALSQSRDLSQNDTLNLDKTGLSLT